METSWSNHGGDKIDLKVWILRIAGARPADSGLYQCQVLLMMLMVKIVIKMIMIFIMIILIFHHFLPVDSGLYQCQVLMMLMVNF